MDNEQGGLFQPIDRLDVGNAPLAARMRPRSFDEFAGQSHLVAPGAAFRVAAESGKLGSAILWGPPGVGKTTLAELIAQAREANFERLSAVSSGVADLRKVIENARRRLHLGQQTLLFIDEIHRFNKAQQDAILQVVEDGTVTLVGATTENPSFEVNSALLSRCRVYVLKSLSDDEVRGVLRRALEDADRGLKSEVRLDEDAETMIVNLSNGDARSALNMLELSSSIVQAAGGDTITTEIVAGAVQRRASLYDKSGEMHFDLISALHKSVRDSDPDASLYWLARMLDGGEDPLYLARRLMRMAIEDIGLADPAALNLAVAAQQAVHFMGQPEGDLALAELAVYLAAAPKSNRVYEAFGAARTDVEATRNDPVPLHLRNAPTRLMKELEYGKGYRYAHDFDEAIVEQSHLPEALEGRRYYEPSARGAEESIAERLEAIRKALAVRKSTS